MHIHPYRAHRACHLRCLGYRVFRGANGEKDSRDASAESDDARGSSDDLGWGDGRR